MQPTNAYNTCKVLVYLTLNVAIRVTTCQKRILPTTNKLQTDLIKLTFYTLHAGQPYSAQNTTCLHLWTFVYSASRNEHIEKWCGWSIAVASWWRLLRRGFPCASRNGVTSAQPQRNIGALQRVQNCAARLICRRKKHDHVTPLLKELHWLPIHVRPTYKLLTIAYSVMHGLAPEYLAELLDRHHPRRVLRSASAELFCVPFSQTVRHGDRRFSVAVATLWNQLPNSVRMIETLPLFRTHLKTHLSRVAFS